MRYTPEPTPAPDEDNESLVSRTDLRRAERELEDTLTRLGKELVELGPRLLERLELPDLVLGAVLDMRAIKSYSARNRQLRVVRAALRESDWSLISARLAALVKHGTIPASLGGDTPSARARAPEWVARLIGEGDPALEALLVIAPSADRVHLGNLIRRVRQQDGPRRQRAEERLSAALESILR
jgi:ribosome-associated protein